MNYIIGAIVIAACLCLLLLKTYELGFKKGFDTAIKTIAHVKIMEMRNDRERDL